MLPQLLPDTHGDGVLGDFEQWLSRTGPAVARAENRLRRESEKQIPHGLESVRDDKNKEPVRDG